MLEQYCTRPAVYTTTAVPCAESLSARVTRLQAALADSMLRKQESWKPASLVEDPVALAHPLQIRRALATARVLAEMPIEIAPDELLVGKTARRGVIVRTALPEYAADAEKERRAKRASALWVDYRTRPRIIRCCWQKACARFSTKSRRKRLRFLPGPKRLSVQKSCC